MKLVYWVVTYTQYIINLLNNHDKVESYKRLSEVDYSMLSDEPLQVYNKILEKRIYKYRMKENLKKKDYLIELADNYEKIIKMNER